jgi:hypothetical protein
MQLEEKNRAETAPYKVRGNFHRWVWARYAYVEYIYRLDREWKANHFTGDLAVSNSDHVKHSKRKKIGVVKYAVPKFTPGPGGAYYFVLTPARSGWTRSTGNRETNQLSGTFFIPFGGSVNLADLTTYASVTSVTYNYVKGCPRGSKRVLWGHGIDPGVARRIQANCFPTECCDETHMAGPEPADHGHDCRARRMRASGGAGRSCACPRSSYLDWRQANPARHRDRAAGSLLRQ